MDLSAYVGLPYQDRGCWELLRRVYREQLGIDVPDYAEAYGRLEARQRAQLAALIAAERRPWLAVQEGQERAGDAVLMRITGHPSHIGVVAEPGRFLHVFQGATACIESYRSPRWRPRLEGFYRHRAAP